MLAVAGQFAADLVTQSWDLEEEFGARDDLAGAFVGVAGVVDFAGATQDGDVLHGGVGAPSNAGLKQKWWNFRGASNLRLKVACGVQGLAKSLLCVAAGVHREARVASAHGLCTTTCPDSAVQCAPTGLRGGWRGEGQ